MNVVKRESRPLKCLQKPKNELVRKDAALGIRGSFIPAMPFNTNASRLPGKTPRYLFSNDARGRKRASMGPPVALPPSLKRKITQSSSTRPASSIDRRHMLASDSAAETSEDLTTPRNRPTALRYISSSSRGGHSGTRSARSTSTSVVEPSVILAISEGRGMARGEIGMAAIDLKHPHLVLCQFSDTLLYTHTLTKINYFNPVEIIVPHTFCEGGKSSQLCQLVREQRPQCAVTAVQRRHFNDAVARQQIQSLCAPHYAGVYLQVLQKFYALTAAAAVLKYVEYIQCIVFARESLKIEYHSSENTMIIDVGTATQLELVQPLVPSAGPTCCLLGVLGPSYTVGGIRALRAALLQPSCDRAFIEARQDAVQELIESDAGLMVDLQNVLKKLTEVDKILFLCIETPNMNADKYGEAQITQTLLLKTTMELVPNLVEALQVAESAQLKKIKMDLENPNYKQIADRIKTIIQDDAHAERGAMGSLQRCFAVKPEINGLLDVARRMYSELIDDIQKIVENLSETYDLPLRMNQNVMKGFHIVMPVAPKNRRHFNVEDLPPVFIQVVFNGANVTMSTEELVVLDHQAKEALSEIQKMTNIVISALLKELRPFMSSLYKLCEDVAEIDVLLAMAQASSIGSYIRPEFNSYLEVRNSVHPLLDYNSQVLPVPNDIFASPEYNFIIITGPNMGGKSVYIKQIAVLQIMAQLGCFVPATNAVFRMSDRIFSRIGFNDSVELNASSYVYEMKEIQHILQGLTSTSLVIVDELCRSTCVEEGTSIAWAVCEEFIASEAFTFFTTHFMYLTRLQELYFNVVNRHAAVTEEGDMTESSQKRLIYQHKIEPGVNSTQRYGLQLASNTNLPPDTVLLARDLAELIHKNILIQQVTTQERSDEALLYKLNADIQLENRKHSNADEYIQKVVQRFKQEHPQLVRRLLLEKSESTKSAGTEKSSTVGHSRQETTKDDLTITNLYDVALQSTPTRQFSKVTQITKQPSVPSPVSHPIANSENPASDNMQYTSVTISTELLNTFANIECGNDGQNSQNTDSYDKIVENTNSFLENHIEIDLTQGEYEYEKEIHSDDDNNNRISKVHVRGDESSCDGYNTRKIDLNDEDTNSTESLDISDELTQVIGLDNPSTESKSDSTESIDEELMTETVNEINEQLMVDSVENLILTPPCGFQD